MTTKIFIDGDAGTTGLEIRERLAGRSDITLLALPQEKRKDGGAKRDILASVDIAILCLPDDAAKETVALCDAIGGGPRLLDASTAHRVADGWVYGFAELCDGQARHHRWVIVSEEVDMRRIPLVPRVGNVKEEEGGSLMLAHLARLPIDTPHGRPTVG